MRKHLDLIVAVCVILGSVFGSAMWLSGKFNQLEKDITIIKTVLIVKNIFPSELAVKDEGQ